MVRVPPPGMASMALSTRFCSARCSRSGSAWMPAIPSSRWNSGVMAGRPTVLNCRSNSLTVLRTASLRFTSWKCGAGILAKIAEAADDGVQVGEFGAKRGSGLEENLVKLLGGLLAGALQIFHGKLQRKKRVLQLVSQAPRQFAPGSDALGL